MQTPQILYQLVTNEWEEILSSTYRWQISNLIQLLIHYLAEEDDKPLKNTPADHLNAEDDVKRSSWMGTQGRSGPS